MTKPKTEKKKSSKNRLTPVTKVVDVDSVESTRRQAVDKQNGAVDQCRNDVPKSSARKGKKKKKKKKGELSVDRNGDVYSNVANSGKRQPVDSSSNSSWAANDTHVGEPKSPRTVQEISPQLSPAGRSPQPLVFEKVTIQDDQIASDYLFHKSVAELTAASAENIANFVGHRTPTMGYSPETVFQYAVTSSFVRQNSPPHFVQPQQQQQQHPASSHPQASFNGSEPRRQMAQKTEDDLPSSAGQRPQPSRPATYFVPLPQPELATDDRSSGSVYDTLDEDKLNSRDSDDQMPPYGLNRRTVVLKSEDAKLGLSVCGGNVSGTFVRTVAANSAAAAAGLTVGDRIVAVNGRVVKDLSKQDVLQRIDNLARDSVRLVVDRDDDRFKLAAPSNAVGDSFHVRAHYSHAPPVRGRELAVRPGDVFQVSDSLPEDAVGYWTAKKVDGGTVAEPEGLIPNGWKAEQIVTRQRLTSSPTPSSRSRGGVFSRSFRRSKYSSDHEQDAADSKPSSECGDVVPYVRVVERSTSVRRPVVLMGLFCDAACAMLRNSAPGVFEIPKTPVEQRRASYEEFSPSTLDLATIRAVIDSGRHCLTVISPRAVQFLREKTDLQPIVVYMSPSSKNALKSMIVQLAPGCDKKPGYMLVEAAKFERYHSALFDAVVPYKADGSWLDLLRDTVGRLQRVRKWIPFEPEDRGGAGDGSPPDLIRTTRTEDREPISRLSKTTDDIPDQIQDLLSRHVNVVSPMVSGRPTDNADDLCTQSFDLGDRRPVLVKPPKAVSVPHGDVVLRKPRTRGRPLSNRDYVQVSGVDEFSTLMIVIYDMI